MQELAASIEKHYSRFPGVEAVLENLKRKGVDLNRVRPEDLYPYDQSHAGGIQATARLAELAGIQPGSRVVDVGCGAAGAARYLHSQFSCRVIGIELTLSRLRVGLQLNRLVGATGVHLIAARAEAMPLPSHSADMVWTQHVTMNLPDHASFLRECVRVLQPAGRIACHEWFLVRSGAPPELHFPLPWAPEPGLNHTMASGEFLELLRIHGFTPEWEDVTEAMVARLRKDNQALAARGGSAQRIAAHENLMRAATGGVLHCLMVTTPPSDAGFGRT